MLGGDNVVRSLSCPAQLMICMHAQENGIMSRLKGIKDVFTEPRRKNEFQAVGV